MSQYSSYYSGSATTVYQTTGTNTTITLYPTGGGTESSAVGPTLGPSRDLDPISWLKARVQETIDAIEWPSAA